MGGKANLRSLLEHDDLITAVCQRNGVDAQVMRELLSLEERYPNLHGWGARPALRRSIAEIIDGSSQGKPGSE